MTRVPHSASPSFPQSLYHYQDCHSRLHSLVILLVFPHLRADFLCTHGRFDVVGQVGRSAGADVVAPADAQEEWNHPAGVLAGDDFVQKFAHTLFSFGLRVLRGGVL